MFLGFYAYIRSVLPGTFMEPHSWIIAIAGAVYLYYLSQIYDKRKIYLIKKSRIHQPVTQDDQEIDLWREQYEKFQRELKLFRINSVLVFLIIPIVEYMAHAYFGKHLEQIWWIPMIIGSVFGVGLAVLLTEMSGPIPLDIKKLDRRSLLYS